MAHDALRSLRRHTRTAAEDATLILAEDERSASTAVRLDEVYIERTIEKDLLAELKKNSSRAPIVIQGEAGTGKTSLLWHLHNELLAIPTYDIWLLKASTARKLEPSILEEAIEQAQSEGKDPILLLDTVDMLLHSEEDRDYLLALLEVMEEHECRLVMTCRPSELRLLPRKYRGQPRPPLGNYDEDELARAIDTHVRRFYARADIRYREEHHAKLTKLVTAHHSLHEICVHPLTLRMLFVLYAPEEIPSEIDIVSLYDRFWEDRVRTDRRAGMKHPDTGAPDLCRAAEAIAIAMLSEGAISVDLSRARQMVREEAASGEHVDVLLGRGVLRMSGDGSVEFFHQTFFEHSAARGLLSTLRGHGLELLMTRVMNRPDDLLTVAVLEQALLISPVHDTSIRTAASGVFEALLQSQHVTLASAAIVIYARMPRVSPELIRQAAIAMESSVVADRFIASIASIRRERACELFVHLGAIWQHAIGARERWGNCEHILDELPRLAARGGAEAALVRSFLDTFRVRDAVLAQDAGTAADRSLLVILAALAPHDLRCWDDFVGIFRGIPASPSKADRIAAVLQTIGRQVGHLGRDRATCDLIDAVGMDRIPFSTDVSRGWGALWAAEWRLRNASTSDILVELRSASGNGFLGMLNGLRAHLLVGNQADGLTAWNEFLAERDVRRQALWSRTVWQELLSDSSNRSDVTEVVGHGIAKLLADPSTERLLAMQLGKSMRSASFPDEVALPLLSDPRVAIPDRWLQLDDLGALLPLAHLRGHEAAMAAMEKLITSPDAFDPKLHESAINTLIERTRLESATLDLLFRLTIAVGDAGALLRILETSTEASATKVLEHCGALEALANRLIDSSKGADRRNGLRLWLVMLSQGLRAHAPSTHDLLRRLERESDAPARGWMAKLIGESAVREGSSDAIAALLKIASTPDANLRKKAFDSLLHLARELHVVDVWLDPILNLALEGETDAGRLRQVGWLVVDLVPQHIPLATTLIERLVTAPAVERLGAAGKRELRSTLRWPMRTWMSAASTAARRTMLDLASLIEPHLGCMLIDAACREVFDEVSGQLGAMLTASSVHDLVKSFIALQIRLRQRREMGSEWPELAWAIAARRGRDLLAPRPPESKQQSTGEITMPYPFPNPLIEAYKHDKLAMLVGSGLSRGADVIGNFPSWEQIPERLLAEVERVGGFDGTQIQAMRALLVNAPQAGSFMTLETMLSGLDTLRDQLKIHRKYQEALNNIFRPRNAKPGDAHRALAKLSIPTLLTTNYDSLIELVDAGNGRTMYTWMEADKALVDIKDGRSILFKIHGTAEREDTIILTRRDYDRVQIHPSYPDVLRLLMQTQTFLFVGFGVNDPHDLELLLERNATAFGAAAEPHYALARKPDQTWRNDLMRRFNVHLIPYDDHAEIPSILRALRKLKP